MPDREDVGEGLRQEGRRAQSPRSSTPTLVMVETKIGMIIVDVSGSGNDGDHKDNKEDENQEQSFNLPSIAQLAHTHPHPPFITIIVFIRRQPHHQSL